MIQRSQYIRQISEALQRSPIVAILGPRQCGKTTLARLYAKEKESEYFDLESQPDVQRLQNAELVLGSMKGLVVLDEIQRIPSLFNTLRVLADRPDNHARFIILGSASPDLVKNVSETLAGRIEFIHLSGFDIGETGADSWESLWLRGGFPRSWLATSDHNSFVWRENFIQTFLERDIPQLGITLPAAAMRRFWTMLAHFHGQLWNASEFSRSMSLTDKTVRSYLDILSGTFMVWQIQPWFENIKKRQVKSPKIYLSDSGLLHALLSVPDIKSLFGHPKVGASWEGFALSQFLQVVQPSQYYFWSTYSGAELDFLFIYRGKRYGVEIKFSEAPKITRSMRVALEDLALEHLWLLYPGEHHYPIEEKISVWPLKEIPNFMEKCLNKKRRRGV